MKLTPYERTKIWRDKNPKKARDQRMKYYYSHLEELREKRKERYKNSKSITN